MLPHPDANPTTRSQGDTAVKQHALAAFQEKGLAWRKQPGGRLPGPRLGGWYAPFKMVAEFVAALVLLILAAPVILVVALLVKLTSRGPVFYSQVRLGKDGRPFTLHKVRTMVHDCERHSGAQWSRPGDPRVTRIGRLLRKTHLDELPQLWNVLKGEMSLVGPRPERPEFVPGLERAIPRYRERLLVRPGVTGLAQVQLPPDTDLASVCLKLTYDVYYLGHLSWWLDLRLIACTALHMFGVPYRFLGRLFRLPSRQAVEDHFRQPPATASGHPAPPRRSEEAETRPVSTSPVAAPASA